MKFKFSNATFEIYNSVIKIHSFLDDPNRKGVTFHQNQVKNIKMEEATDTKEGYFLFILNDGSGESVESLADAKNSDYALISGIKMNHFLVGMFTYFLRVTNGEKLNDKQLVNAINSEIKKSPQAKKIKKNVLLFYCVCMVIIFLFYIVSGSIGAEGSGTRKSSDRHLSNISVLAKKTVEDSLKSPSSAKFSNVNVIKVSEGKYNVTGAVEAENSFGTKVKNTFSMTFTVTSSGDYYHENLRFYE